MDGSAKENSAARSGVVVASIIQQARHVRALWLSAAEARASVDAVLPKSGYTAVTRTPESKKPTG